SVVFERPVLHIITYPDGTTNQPLREQRQETGKTTVERLFALSVNRVEVRRGKLLWNDQEIPLDFVANDVSVDMDYSFLHRRYESNMLLGKVDTTIDGFRPLAWTGEAHFNLSQNSIEIKTLKASSGRSHLEASGKVNGFRQPQIDATYNLTLDLTEA